MLASSSMIRMRVLAHAGICRVNWAPWGLTLCTSTAPLCSFMIWTDDGQPEPGAFLLGREVGQEELVLVLDRDAGPGVRRSSTWTWLGCRGRSAARTRILPFLFMASIALSMRLMKTRFICSGSSGRRGRHVGVDRRPRRRCRRRCRRKRAATWSMISAREAGWRLILGRRAKSENSSTSDLIVWASWMMTRAPSSMTAGAAGLGPARGS